VQLGRRAFLGAAGATIAAACAPEGAGSAVTAAPSVGPPETTAIRFSGPAPCDPWTWLVGDFLKEEGFTTVESGTGGVATNDIAVTYGNNYVASVDAGEPYIALGGTHVGCMELWALPGINSVRDLRGKRLVATKPDVLNDLIYGLWVSLLTTFGVDPSEVAFTFNTDTTKTPVDYFVEGRSDAVVAIGLGGAQLMANPKNPGKQIFDTSVDKPWSQHFCCLLLAKREWAKANPNAAKRATRAVLRAIDYGAQDRQRAVTSAVDKKLGVATNPAILFETIKALPYDWRAYDPAESLRFYALRLADAKLLKKTPSQILADGTDFAFFRQMQKELKA
jgi:NitT/TauT family transport system substrate-binding protein